MSGEPQVWYSYSPAIAVKCTSSLYSDIGRLFSGHYCCCFSFKVKIMRNREIRKEGSGGVLSATGQYVRVRRSFPGISRAATEDTVSPQARQDAFICILSGDILFLLWRADQIMLVFSRKFQTGLFPISVCSCPRPFCMQPLMRGTLVFCY